MGENSAWSQGKFSGGLHLDGNSGHVDFGPVRIEGNYSFSIWVKPDLNATDDESPMMNILSKVGVLGMNHFQLYKQEGNGSIAFALNRDGNSSQSLHQTNESVLNEDEWNHLLLTHNPENGT